MNSSGLCYHHLEYVMLTRVLSTVANWAISGVVYLVMGAIVLANTIGYLKEVGVM